MFYLELYMKTILTEAPVFFIIWVYIQENDKPSIVSVLYLLLFPNYGYWSFYPRVWRSKSTTISFTKSSYIKKESLSSELRDLYVWHPPTSQIKQRANDELSNTRYRCQWYLIKNVYIFFKDILIYSWLCMCASAYKLQLHLNAIVMVLCSCLYCVRIPVM